MVDSISNDGFNWDAWFQNDMQNWTPADTKLFMKQETGCINAFMGEVKQAHEDAKKANDEILNEANS